MRLDADLADSTRQSVVHTPKAADSEENATDGRGW
jgi:hypothetical protein